MLLHLFVRLSLAAVYLGWLSRKNEHRSHGAKHYNACKRNIARILDGRIATEKIHNWCAGGRRRARAFTSSKHIYALPKYIFHIYCVLECASDSSGAREIGFKISSQNGQNEGMNEQNEIYYACDHDEK